MSKIIFVFCLTLFLSVHANANIFERILLPLKCYENDEEYQTKVDVCSALLEEETDPDAKARYLVHRGIAHSMAGKNDKAIADLDKAIQLAPDYDDAHAVRARTNFYLGKFSEVISDTEMAVSLGRELQTASRLSYAISLERSDRLDAALEQFDRAYAESDAAVDKLKFNHRYHQGRAYDKAGQLEPAIEAYSRAIMNYPEFPWAYFARGLVNEKLGRMEQAKADLELARMKFAEYPVFQPQPQSDDEALVAATMNRFGL